MMMTGGVASERQLENAHDARVGEERHRLRLAQERGESSRAAPGSVQHLRRDEPVQLEVVQLVDGAHAAPADALHSPESVDSEGDVRVRGRAVGGPGVELLSQLEILANQILEQRGQVGPIGHDRVDRGQLAVPRVVFHDPREPALEVVVVAHDASPVAQPNGQRGHRPGKGDPAGVFTLAKPRADLRQT